MALALFYHGSISGPSEHWISGDPRQLWPLETTHLHPWLVDNLDALARCLGLERLEITGREVQIGTQRLDEDRWVGGMRVDVDARDERGRRVVVEAQLGPDHGHLGQLLVYAHGAEADLAVWLIAHHEPSLHGEQLELLAELNALYAGRREFAVVGLTVESEHRPTRIEDDPLLPRLRRTDLATHTRGPAVTARLPVCTPAGFVPEAGAAPGTKPGRRGCAGDI